MPISTDQLFIILLGADESEPNSYNFCINRALIDVAPVIPSLRDISGVDDFIAAESNLDDNGSDQAIITLAFESYDNMPAVFGRIACALANHFGMTYAETLLFREVAASLSDDDNLSFMELPEYIQRFPGIFDGSVYDARRDEQVLAELDKSFNVA